MAGAGRPTGFVWWKHGVIYQVYPRSFQDSDGDGVGDLEGLISRLGYLVDLGIDAVWLSPIFRSPMADFGYDVEDHVTVDPLFGDLATFRRLVDAAHGLGLKLILDYVPNHTSDSHLAFQESRSSPASPRRDWYIWRDGRADGGPPNNWRSEFGGPAWTRDPESGQYYYHAFLPSQPDLNWRNPAVSEFMLDVLRFWFDLGVDGFRVDAIHHLFEREDLADNPANPDWRPGMAPTEQLLRLHTIDQPEVHATITSMRRLADGYGGILVGEAYLPIDRLMAYYGGAGDGFHLPFNFHLMSTPWTPEAIAQLIADYEIRLPPGGWPNWVLGNHDRSRLASRLGKAQARVAAMLLLTLRGTPTLYQGDELGMTDVVIPPDQVRDPWEINMPGQGLGRDPVRTPMPWTREPQAGFTAGEPWLPLSPDWTEINAAEQSTDPRSILRLYRDLLALRRTEPALTMGDFALVRASEGLLAFERRLEDERLVVVLDLTGNGGSLEIPPARRLLSTDGDHGEAQLGGHVRLAPNQGVVLKLTWSGMRKSGSRFFASIPL